MICCFTVPLLDTTYESLISLPIYSSSANIKIPCATLTSIIGLPVKWYFRSKPIGNDSVRHTVLGNGELYIIASTLVDNGEYTCVVGDIAIKRHLTIEGIILHVYYHNDQISEISSLYSKI